METIINKISSYNLFNYLFTGIIFVIFLYAFLDIKLYIESNDTPMQIANLFWVYFIGLTISRISSVVIEPIIRVFVKFADYKDFQNAQKDDKKLEILSEQNNIYRTLLTLFLLLGSLYILESCECNICIWTKENYQIIFLVTLIWLYLFSYKKQIGYIAKRVQNHKEKQNG